MPYIRNGQVVAQRSVFRPSIIMEIFWKVLNIVGLFFGTMSAVRVSSSWSAKRSDKHRAAGGCSKRDYRTTSHAPRWLLDWKDSGLVEATFTAQPHPRLAGGFKR
ncbi:unnamed protein product [Ectocarpus sp. 12 AP-2014]